MEWRKTSSSFPCMGTLIRITVWSKHDPTPAILEARKRFEELDARLSDYKPTSEVNQLRSHTTTAVSRDLFEILKFSQRLSLASNGAFDVTIGARTRGRSGTVGFTHLALGKQTVTLLADNMQLDLGGIAKGYANDEASKVLLRHGIKRHLIAASGDILVHDAPPHQAGWKISFQNETRTMTRAAVSTSGNTYQPLHILDPRTLTPVTTTQTLSVVAKNSMTADALDTACLILTPPERVALARLYGVEVVSA